jgi:hypothetical protein
MDSYAEKSYNIWKPEDGNLPVGNTIATIKGRKTILTNRALICT